MGDAAVETAAVVIINGRRTLSVPATIRGFNATDGGCCSGVAGSGHQPSQGDSDE